MALPSRRHVPLTQRNHVVNHREQAQGAEWLRHVTVCASVQGFYLAATPRHDHDCKPIKGPIGPHFTAYGEAIEDRHLDVEQNDIGSMQRQLSQGFLAISSFEYAVRVLQRVAEEQSNPGIVVNHEHFHHGLVHFLSHCDTIDFFTIREDRKKYVETQ